MCFCQTYGKSGVPNARGNCLVCGEPVWPTLSDTPTHGRASSTVGLPPALTGPMTEDRCRTCGTLIGWGLAAFHLGLCETCRAGETGDAADDGPGPEVH
jgi:hypothetical protein